MSLHRYLYCVNDPVNKVDPTGEIFGLVSTLAGVAIHNAFRNTEFALKADALALAITATGWIVDIFYVWPTVKKAFNDSDGVDHEIKKNYDFEGKDAEEILKDIGIE